MTKSNRPPSVWTAVANAAVFVLGVAFCLFVLTPLGAAAAPGELDPSFGDGGLVTTDIGESIFGRVTGIAVQPDGKIVAAGECAGTVSGLAGQNAYCLARYETDGSLDSSFGTGGKVVTSFRAGAAHPFDGLDGGIALQEDGKIVVATSCPIIEGQFVVAQVFCVIRFNTDGSLDDVGSAFISRFANARAVTIQPDGKIVVAGYCSASGIIPSAFCLARFTADLGLDPSWGGDFAGGDGCMLPRPDGCDFVYPAGTIAHMVAGSDATAAFGVVSQPGGKVVAVGSCLLPRSNVPGSQFFCLARWNASGHDLTVTTAIRDHADATNAVVQPDGKIVVAGRCSPGTQFCLARYNAADLSLDGSFGTGGATDPIEPAPGGDYPFAVALQPDGKIVAAGLCDNAAFCLRRYSSDGILDDSFGTDGKATADFGPGVDFALALAIQEDGKSVAAGQCEGLAPFCLARFDAEATDTNQAPTDIALSPISVAENESAGTTVGSFSTTDPDIGDSHSYSLVAGAGDADNDAFTITGGELKAAASFDFETTAGYTIRVRSADGGGLSVEKQFTISVTNVNEAPLGANDTYSTNLGTNLAVPMASGVLANDADPDAGTTLSAILDSGTTHGTLTLAGDGSFLYTPRCRLRRQ